MIKPVKVREVKDATPSRLLAWSKEILILGGLFNPLRTFEFRCDVRHAAKSQTLRRDTYPVALGFNIKIQ